MIFPYINFSATEKKHRHHFKVNKNLIFYIQQKSKKKLRKETLQFAVNILLGKTSF